MYLQNAVKSIFNFAFTYSGFIFPGKQNPRKSMALSE